MFQRLLLLVVIWVPFHLNAQTYHQYNISFPEATHHLAEVSLEFPALENKTLKVRMSRTSPGRYAIHDFAKNVFDIKAFDSKGNELKVTRSEPQQWEVGGHDGYVRFTYQLFADRADGTYSQIDESHAHLNIPATFMYAENYEHRPIRVKFDVTGRIGWKVATQLEDRGDGFFYAPNLYYLMDSPTEISDFVLKEFEEESNGKTYKIRFALHHDGDSEELIQKYFENVKAIVKEEKAVFNALPDFDFGTYTFLACYRNNASGDGMEHRNSTILTDSYGLRNGGFNDHIGTVSHEFFHAWNVERIRPAALEPFSFEDANMSGELWFAEGFTSYYTRLILCRAGIISEDQYVERLSSALNYVWNSPARNYFNPIEMSYQAPFVDAATSVDPTNWRNTFISYYSYGSVLGLALDLSLRKKGDNLTLDGLMQQIWKNYGEKEIPYSVRDLENELADYAGETFSNEFFNNYIYASNKPKYKELLAAVGVQYELANPGMAYSGLRLKKEKEGLIISANPSSNSPAYIAGLTDGDLLLTVKGKKISEAKDFSQIIKKSKIGDKISLKIMRFGKEKFIEMTLQQDPQMVTKVVKSGNGKEFKSNKVARTSWLQKVSD